MKKIVFALLAVVLIGGAYLLFGFERSSFIEDSNDVVIAGSSSGIRILKPIAELYEKKYPGKNIKFLVGTSTGDGVKGVSENLLDIGVSARKMSDLEKEQYLNVEEHVFVKDAMVLGVHDGVSLSNLSSEQVVDIHSGEIVNWSDIGGADELIIVMDREETESSKIILRDKILGKALQITNSAILLHSSGAMNRAVADTPYSIGQLSLGTINMQELPIKSLSIDGVEPNYLNIENGTYQLVREYGVVTRKESTTALALDFIKFLSEKESRDFLLSNEMLPALN